MNANTDLPQQPDVYQNQQPLIKKSNKILWLSFFIILIILHLPFGWILAYIFPRVSINSFHFYLLALSPLFLTLMILDFIAYMLFHKETPPWKVCFILLFIFNVLFFSEAKFAMRGPSGEMGLIVILPLALLLVIIDLIALLLYHYS